MFGGVPKSEVEQLEEYWNAWPSLKAELFRDNGVCYACDHDDIATVVRNNADVQAFIASYGQAISGLPVDLRSRLVEHPEQVDALEAGNSHWQGTGCDGCRYRADRPV